jgi:hypothetical protein
MEESKPLQILPPPKNLAPLPKKEVADRIEINIEKERKESKPRKKNPTRKNTHHLRSSSTWSYSLSAMQKMMLVTLSN